VEVSQISRIGCTACKYATGFWSLSYYYRRPHLRLASRGPESIYQLVRRNVKTRPSQTHSQVQILSYSLKRNALFCISTIGRAGFLLNKFFVTGVYGLETCYRSDTPSLLQGLDASFIYHELFYFSLLCAIVNSHGSPHIVTGYEPSGRYSLSPFPLKPREYRYTISHDVIQP